MITSAITSRVSTSENVEPGTSPIGSCNSDVLGLIFHHIVEDEAIDLYLRPSNDRLRMQRPKAAIRLMLVSRRWHQMVVSTPGLWRVLVIGLDSPLKQVQPRYRRFSTLAKGTPVDLYIYNLHVHDIASYCNHMVGHCPSQKAVITDILDSLPNIRTLSIEFRGNISKLRHFPECWSNSPTVQEFIFQAIAAAPSAGDQSLVPHVQGMPNLRIFRLEFAGDVYIPASVDGHLLPNLVILELETNWKRLTTIQFVTLLWHCPRLKKLTCIGCSHQGTDDVPNIQPFELQYLRSIAVRDNFLDPFTSLIETPSLQALDCRSVKPDLLEQIIQNIPTIEKLYLHEGQNQDTLRRLINIRPMEIVCTGYSTIHIELQIPTPTLKRDERGQGYCASIETNAALSPGLFEDLVKTRLLPLTKDGLTSAGCKALSELVVLGDFDKVFKHVRGSALFRKASVTKSSITETRLRWDFEETSFL